MHEATLLYQENPDRHSREVSICTVHSMIQMTRHMLFRGVLNYAVPCNPAYCAGMTALKCLAGAEQDQTGSV